MTRYRTFKRLPGLFASTLIFLFLLSGLVLAVENNPLTIVRDTDGCTINFTLQIGVESINPDAGDDDVAKVKNALAACFPKECYIRCAKPSVKKCKVVVNVDVKDWGALGADQAKYYHIKVVKKKVISSVLIGTANAPIDQYVHAKWYGYETGAHGVWWRTASNTVYCHEAGHLIGLKDKYCGRNNWGGKEAKCEFAPRPCDCTPPAIPPDPPPPRERCSKNCKDAAGNEYTGIMSASLGAFSCVNILQAVDKAGLNDCPWIPCCGEPPVDNGQHHDNLDGYKPFHGNPSGGNWHKGLPIFCVPMQAPSWVDNGDSILSADDLMEFFNLYTEELSWEMVEWVMPMIKVTNIYSPDTVRYLEQLDDNPLVEDITEPIASMWLEIYPNFGMVYEIEYWEDNGNGYLDSCDYIGLHTLSEPGYCNVEDYHVESFVTCIITSPLDTCDGFCGDANGDEIVNVSDAVFIINYVFVGGSLPVPLACGDANSDGTVNVSDAVYIINYVFVSGPIPEDCAPGSPNWSDGDCCPFVP